MNTEDPTRALIVEDDPVVARAIARRLLREGYTVSLAGNCRAARAAGRGFRAAILDLDLPDGSGCDLAEDLLRQGAVQGIVFYTGSLDGAQRERAQLLGRVVDKTEDLEQVVQELEPIPTAPPVSQMAPAHRPRTRAASGQLSRVTTEEEQPGSVASSSSSRR